MQQADRSLRSVFVGNIPYDATEERLRDIFGAVGPVLSFRIVFDRDTGKPKGYGFCEYKDEETATSAIRNLNGHDLGGRQLRVDSATNERARDDPDQQKNQQQNPQGAEQMHQPQPVAEPLVDAQTVINNVLCSLPPENLFDICRQLKMSLLINPNETRQMLVQNPQLSFAILQTLVMIKAIDPNTAMNTLHKQLMQPAPLQPAVPTMMAMMQPQVLNPYAFVGQSQPTGLPQPVQPGPAAPPVVTLPPQAQAQLPPPNTTLPDPRLTATDPRLAPTTVDPRLAAADPRLNASAPTSAVDPRLMAADPRLSRQQHHIQQHPQQQQQPPQQQQQQQTPQQIHQPGWPFVGV